MKSFAIHITLNFFLSRSFYSHTPTSNLSKAGVDKQIKWKEKMRQKIISTLILCDVDFFFHYFRVHTFRELIIMCMHKYIQFFTTYVVWWLAFLLSTFAKLFFSFNFYPSTFLPCYTCVIWISCSRLNVVSFLVTGKVISGFFMFVSCKLRQFDEGCVI